MSQLLTTPVATDGGARMRLTKASAVGEKSLLCTESRCPAKRRTLWPDCRESLSYRDGGGSPGACGPLLGLAFGATGLSELAGPCHRREGQCGLRTAMQGGKALGTWVQKAHTSDPGPIFSYLYLPENDLPVPAT